MKKVCLLLCIILLFVTPYAESKEKKVLGWLELVRVYPGNIRLRAKMDTGAKSSSLNVHNLKRFKKNDEIWVSFDIIPKSKNNPNQPPYRLEKKIIDTVKIKRRGGGVEERIVVNMQVCVIGILKDIRMNLYDRSNFNYQILIGRDDLKDDFIIDPSETFTGKSKCKIKVSVEP